MQTGAMTMKSRMTVTEALKERELLKKRITKKIGRLGREAGTDGAFAERRSARFDASKTGRKQAQSAVSGNIGHGAVSDGTSAHLDAALQQIRALILRYDSDLQRGRQIERRDMAGYLARLYDRLGGSRPAQPPER